jgi:senataxin
MVLVGDDKQLDPTVISQDKLLKESVFSKLSQKKPEYFVLLDTQYRMHPEISEFPNAYFYESRLKDGVSAEERQNNIYYFAYHPVSFINHNVLESFYEDSENGKKNYYN